MSVLSRSQNGGEREQFDTSEFVLETMKLDFNEQAKLNGQAQDIQIDQTYTLNFMNQKTFDITTNCLKVSSHLHNDSQYCTVVFHGLASFTFELEENKPM